MLILSIYTKDEKISNKLVKKKKKRLVSIKMKIKKIFSSLYFLQKIRSTN